MKKLLLGIAGMVSFLSASAQQDPYQAVIDRIIKNYNDKNYKAFHELLSPDFKEQQDENTLKTFFQTNVYPYYGKFKSVTFLEEKAPFRHYKTVCEKGTLELLLACNDKQEISGLSLQPYKERALEKKPVVSDNPKQTALDLEVDSLVQSYMSDPANESLSIGIVHQGNVLFYHYGEVKKGSAALPSNSSLYEIGSITKTFTGILLAKAIEEQKVKADDDIRRYLPESCKGLAYKNTAITLVQLANHTSGLPRIPENLTKQKNFDEQDPYKYYSKEMLYTYLSKLKLKTMPGTVSEYSNTGMALLGLILAEVYGKSYAELVKEKITGPLHMDHTYVEVPAEQAAAFCTGYDETGRETKHWNFTDLTACGGLRSTPENMMQYLKANMEEQDKAIALSHTATFQSGKYSAIGMAWQRQQSLSGDETIWHNGATYGFSSFLGFVKGKEVGVLILSNSGNTVDEIAIKLLKYLKK